MKMAELIEQIQALGQRVRNITLDSRQVTSGTLFVACPGATAQSKDGHDFIQLAAERGAVAIVADNPKKIPQNLKIPVWICENARKACAVLAEAIYGSPSTHLNVVGITGTNGKTTLSFLLATIFAHQGKKAGVLGTLGFGGLEQLSPLGFTTPEAPQLSQTLAELKRQEFTHVAMEVSSHALATYRADGVHFEGAAFTNLSQDHLDFHVTMDAYAQAKDRLFLELLPAQKPAALPLGHHLIEKLKPTHPVVSWGRSSQADVHLVTSFADVSGLRLTLSICDQIVELQTRLIGDFNIDNILCAAALAFGMGIPAKDIADALTVTKPVLGRLSPVGTSRANEPRVFVDYAHTPDALFRTLQTLRPVTKQKLITVFGCGGNRDSDKRPKMGRIAGEYSDFAIVTNDNPRKENPGAILQQILQGLNETGKNYAVIPDRREAIRVAIAIANPGDVVLIAGKGHETTQEFSDVTIPFDDSAQALHALEEKII